MYVFVSELSRVDVVINVPDELDLNHLRGRSLQPGEEELQEGGPPSDQAPPQPGTTVLRVLAMSSKKLM